MVKKIADEIMLQELSEEYARMLDGNDALQNEVGIFMEKEKGVSWQEAVLVMWLLLAMWRDKWAKAGIPMAEKYTTLKGRL